MKLMPQRLQSPRPQRGAAMVEFALVAMIFFMLLLGIMEFGRWMFTLNAASEATRWGARLAAVCDLNEPQIKEKMRSIVPGMEDAQISITYSPSGCTAANCRMVEVKLVDMYFTPLLPFMGIEVPVPPFTTTLTRELMNSAGNPVCS